MADVIAVEITPPEKIEVQATLDPGLIEIHLYETRDLVELLPTGEEAEVFTVGPQGPPGPAGPSGGVQSVNTKTGQVVLNAGDVGATTEQAVRTDIGARFQVGGTQPSIGSGLVWLRPT